MAAAGTDTRRSRARPRNTHALTIAAAVVALVGVWLAKDVLAPVAVAAVVVIIAHPVRRPLERRGWPAWAATTVVIAVSFAILGGTRSTARRGIRPVHHDAARLRR